MDIVIPFRNTCGNEELQMCVKLIEKNLHIDINKIYILGDSCNFKHNLVENIVVEEQKYNKWLDSGFLVQYYIENISQKPFILFNDDFFITAPVNKVPSFYYNTLENRLLTTNVIDVKINKLRQSAYGLNILKFISIFGDFENYEVHIPLIIKYPDKMLEAIKLSKDFDCPALKRTLYMKLLKDSNLLDESTSLDNDIKFGEPYKTIQYPFFSLTDKEYEVFKDIFENIYKN